MVEITKNGKTLTVSMGAFKDNFKDQGWKISSKNDTEVEAKSASTSEDFETEDDMPEEVEETEEVDESEWDELEDEDVEKPISEMSKDELREKAASLGLDVPSNCKISQLREMVREAMQ